MTQNEYIEELKSDIDTAMGLYNSSITDFARDVWITKADGYAHKLAKLGNEN